MKAHQYPKQIIPAKGWRNPIPTDEAIKYSSDLCIARRFDGLLEEYVADFGDGDFEIDLAGLLKPEEVFNLSTNLIGKSFRYNHHRFRQIGKGCSDWKEQKIHPVDFPEGLCYKFLEGDLFVLGWKIAELEGLSFPFERNFSNFDQLKSFVKKITVSEHKDEMLSDVKLAKGEDIKTIWDKLPEDGNKEKYAEIHCVFHIRHMPTNLNYWHFTIDFTTDENSNKFIDNKKFSKLSWKQKMTGVVLDILANHVEIIDRSHTSFSINQRWLCFEHKANVFRKTRW